MSAVSFPVSRPAGRALIVASPAARAMALGVLGRLGFQCSEADDPYAAMAELCRRPLAYRAVILSLATLYTEELAIIQTIKQRFNHLEIWLTNTDGRQSAMAEALRLGADGFLDASGPQRAAGASTVQPLHDPISAMPLPEEPASPASAAAKGEGPTEAEYAEPILSADELRALLDEEPIAPQAEAEQ